MKMRNDKKIVIYTQKMAIWDEYQQSKRDSEMKGTPPPPLPGYHGQTMRRKPREPRKPVSKELEMPMV